MVFSNKDKVISPLLSITEWSWLNNLILVIFDIKDFYENYYMFIILINIMSRMILMPEKKNSIKYVQQSALSSIFIYALF